MSTDPDRPPMHVASRPGVLKGLGIANVVFAVLNGFCVFSMLFWCVSGATTAPPDVEIALEKGAKSGPGVPTAAGSNPMLVGMDDPTFMRFSLVEGGVGMLTSGLMFATGLGLLNLRRWGARGWGVLAWAKLVLNVLFWSYYLVAVAPGFSEHMARGVMTLIQQQGAARGRGPNLADLTRVYSIMNLIVAVGAIVLGSIYPAISLWLLSRPGVEAAIVDRPILERELP